MTEKFPGGKEGEPREESFRMLETVRVRRETGEIEEGWTFLRVEKDEKGGAVAVVFQRGEKVKDTEGREGYPQKKIPLQELLELNPKGKKE